MLLLLIAVGAAVLLLALPGERASAQAAGLCDTGSVEQFSDVKPDAYAAEYIHCMRALGLSEGRGDGIYGPELELNRGQMASFLVRLWRDVLGNGCPEGPSAPFTDIAGTTHQENIECLYALGITKGTTDTLFGPVDKLKASQISRFLLRTYESADRTCPQGSNELDRAAACLVSLNVVPAEDEARSATPVIRAQMAVYVIGAWHQMTGRGLPPTPPTRPTAEQLEVLAAEFHLIDLVNDLRADLDLPPYEYHPEVAAGARRWVGAMAAIGTPGRNPYLASDYPQARRTAQNVRLLTDLGDESVRELTEEAFSAMRDDPDAYHEMTDPLFTDTGVGILVDRNGFWAVQDFVEYDPPPTEAEISDGENLHDRACQRIAGGPGRKRLAVPPGCGRRGPPLVRNHVREGHLRAQPVLRVRVPVRLDQGG